MTNRVYQKHFFTLIEFFICIAIIGIIGSVVSLRLISSLSHYCFKKNCERIEEMVMTTKRIAVSNQADMVLFFSQNPKGLLITRGSDDRQGVFRGEKKEERYFEDIFCCIDNKPILSMEVIFSSTGRILPAVLLRIKNGNDKKKFSKELSLLE